MTLPLKVALGLVLAAVAVVGLTNLVTIGTTRGDVHTIADVADYNADAIVVLGASVHADGTPSDMLRHRLDTAWALYDAGAAQAIIVSGDNREANYNESAAMKKYLVNLGIPSEDIYEDHAGYSTYESMYRARLPLRRPRPGDGSGGRGQRSRCLPKPNVLQPSGSTGPHQGLLQHLAAELPRGNRPHSGRRRTSGSRGIRRFVVRGRAGRVPCQLPGNKKAEIESLPYEFDLD